MITLAKRTGQPMKKSLKMTKLAPNQAREVKMKKMTKDLRRFMACRGAMVFI
jgi:hypothetical protein